MRKYLLGQGIKPPETHVNAAKGLKVSKSYGTLVDRQYQDCCICIVPIPMRLNHSFSPVIKLDFKCSDGWMSCCDELLYGATMMHSIARWPSYNDEVGNSAPVDDYLPGVCTLDFSSSTMNPPSLLKIGPGKPNSEPIFTSWDSPYSVGQISFRMTEVGSGHSDCTCTRHTRFIRHAQLEINS
ncbi:MAG: hypothetical protein QME66_09470 [Candidatus Eisenbacteria bacterium]|nr:hypothetical protein [Candidatus Eisenbacteria bacterium]